MKKTRKIRTFEGLPVVDAKHDIVVNVTAAADVKGSHKKNPNSCAAAVAGKRELRKDVRVFLSRMYVKEKKHWVRYVTSNNAAREIVSFDRGSAFEPGKYKFKAASEGQQLGYKKSNNHNSTGKGLKREHHMTTNVRISAKERWDSK